MPKVEKLEKDREPNVKDGEIQFLVDCGALGISPDFLKDVIDAGDKQPFYLATDRLSNRQKRQKRLVSWLKIHPYLIHFLEDYLEEEPSGPYQQMPRNEFLSILATYPPHYLAHLYRQLHLQSTPEFMHFYRGGGMKTRLLERMVKLIRDCPFILEPHRSCLGKKKGARRKKHIRELDLISCYPPKNNDTIEWYTEAVNFLKKGCYEYAILCFTFAINEGINLQNTKYNRYHRAFYWRGHAFLKLGQYTQAINDFCEIIALNPSDKYIYNDRGRAFEKLGEITAAMADYKLAYRLNTHLAEVPFIRMTKLAKCMFRK